MPPGVGVVPPALRTTLQPSPSLLHGLHGERGLSSQLPMGVLRALGYRYAIRPRRNTAPLMRPCGPAPSSLSVFP